MNELPLTPNEEATLLKNLLSDPDDFASGQLLALHYRHIRKDTNTNDKDI